MFLIAASPPPQLAVALAEEHRLAADRIAAATRLRAIETETATAADRVTALALRQNAAEAALARRAAAMAPFLPLIQRLALYPSETLLAAPMPPEQAVRGILVLGGLTRQLEQEAAALRTEQAGLATLAKDLARAVPELAARQADQAREAASLDRQLEAARIRRVAVEGEVAEQARRAAAEAARAENLRAAIARLEAERVANEARQAAQARATPPPPDPRPRQEAAARPAGPLSSLTTPVAGTIAHRFGDQVDGSSATGLAYQVPPSARVVAPCGGRVVFAGPFRSFGLLAIVDCGAGWHVVLSGFAKLDAGLGHSVQPGEPLGAMPAWDPLALIRRPLLLLELRHDGQPMNPAPLLQAKG